MKPKKRLSEKRIRLLALLSKITDFLLLGLIALVCSLPVITLGAAAAAFYTVGLSLIRKEERSLYKTFFSVFRSEFRHVTPTWLVLLLCELLLAANAVFYFIMASNGAIWAQFGLGMCAAGALGLSFAAGFVFPILAKNDDLLGRDAIKVSFYLAGRQWKWWTLKTVVQAAVFAAVWFVPFLVILAPGVLLFSNSFCYDRAFQTQFPKKTA